ncbi:MAG TPA: hypothetical protein EYQ50_28065 [Verrucomicrobiales bacterium]|nr:hypothetical protein [Verrucomicrobiales bacterium]
MLVLFVIVVVVFEVRYAASVELDHSRAVLYETRMRWLADVRSIRRAHAGEPLAEEVEHDVVQHRPVSSSP